MVKIYRFHHRKGEMLVFVRKQAFFVPFGGDKRDRTADLLNAIQALSSGNRAVSSKEKIAFSMQEVADLDCYIKAHILMQFLVDNILLKIAFRMSIGH